MTLRQQSIRQKPISRELRQALAIGLRARFAIRLRDLREARKLTQEQAAKAWDIDRGHLCDLENGQVNVLIHTVDKVAKGLGISLSKLVKGL